ncbi:nucleotidyl transferase AbiEii/AbiGii toxin family protein [Candidatus Berkelbacteria bacterium]|nr:nucleotidyl transferase AbiEii/AbiGii toxin family protein [Candidatus Berkelbacteria bacterium]
MHREILSDRQANLLPLIQTFSNQFGLVGGTAIALHIGHRQSIDFDLFATSEFDAQTVRQQIIARNTIDAVLRDSLGEYTIVVDGVKCTFFHYPFPVVFSEQFDDVIKLPNLVTLAALKAYALGRRSTWKDYVDLFFIFQQHPLGEVVTQAKQLFGNEFNEKLFRSQLTYYADLDLSEQMSYLPGKEQSDDAIKRALTALAVA